MESSNTGGVKPMTIIGRTGRERERLIGMTNEERLWRKTWLKDQILSADEPRYVPEYWKEIRNPIRRFYQAPLNVLHKALTPVMVLKYRLYNQRTFVYIFNILGILSGFLCAILDW